MYSLSEILNKWQPLAPFLSVPHTEAEYDNLSTFLDQLFDEVGNDDFHPLAALMDTVGTLIEAYDKEHFPFLEGDPIGVLKYLMANHDLTQSNLPELGSQGVVSEIVSGKRSLNVRQIKLLSKRFHMSPSTFL
ncbi:MAG: transcriptional regulator [Thermodesulfobacteriota bacterium]|nr:transcriptional regulator [Thermodesulfobacteriota bacterium]